MSSEFSIKKTPIEGLLEIDIHGIADNRGYFQEKFQKAKLVVLGLPENFNPVQQNISFNKEVGVTRGIHAEPWDKYVSVISGKVFAAFVDLRPENFGKVFVTEIDESKCVFVPKGVGNSYQTLVPNVYYSYLVNDHWSAEAKYTSINPTDPDLHIPWPIAMDQAIVSDKDRQHPMLKEIKV